MNLIQITQYPHNTISHSYVQQQHFMTHIIVHNFPFSFPHYMTYSLWIFNTALKTHGSLISRWLTYISPAKTGIFHRFFWGVSNNFPIPSRIPGQGTLAAASTNSIPSPGGMSPVAQRPLGKNPWWSQPVDFGESMGFLFVDVFFCVFFHGICLMFFSFHFLMGFSRV